MRPFGRLLALSARAGAALAACERGRAPVANQTPPFYVSMASADAVVDAVAARDMLGAYRRTTGRGPLSVAPGLQALAEAESAAMARADRPASAVAVKARLAAA